jgi:ABC-2 type transport system ATP-binding protein
VGLAQALLSDPQVLILDEPTSGLDPAEINRIRRFIARLGRTKTILLSTHILSEVQETCRRVIILAAGRIVADGTPLDLARGEPVTLHVTLRAPSVDLVTEFTNLEGVNAARSAGIDSEGRTGLALSVTDHLEIARAVARLAAERGWELFELRPELPSLEQVFLQCTEVGNEPWGGGGAR